MLRDRSGATAVITGLAIIVILGFVGLAVDVASPSAFGRAGGAVSSLALEAGSQMQAPLSESQADCWQFSGVQASGGGRH